MLCEFFFPPAFFVSQTLFVIPSHLTFLTLVFVFRRVRAVDPPAPRPPLPVSVRVSPFAFSLLLLLLSLARVSAAAKVSAAQPTPAWGHWGGGLGYSGKFAAHAAGTPVLLWLGFSCRLPPYAHMHLLCAHTGHMVQPGPPETRPPPVQEHYLFKATNSAD